uniref:nucleoside diphosphate-linked moiety X motif 17 isoform X2 n=1 Tax=Gasterosteus aculeatus aculeatus TaxID=481459 RepID=UPI001A980F5F|nr:nucleoside diphosphate-linked moiety X motif 17 isoform X2 [Gasterosteus aculeatus aculeatus]
MDKVRRVLVHVCKDQSAPQRAQFVQSVTGHFSDGGDDEVEVSCSLERKQFVLFRGDGRRGTPLKRPAFCPIKHLSVSQSAAIPLDVQRRGVDVGVAIILQTANRRVLLTRRAKELRIFPNVWVPPGGHLEPEETLLEAGLRELKEETGLDLEPEGVSPKILGLWELQASLRPSPAEVSACLWADRQLVGAVVSSVDAEDGHVPLHHLQGSVSVSQVFSDGALSEAALPLEVLLGRAPACGPDVERVSTGTKFALELWLKSLEDLRPLTPPEKML